MTDSTSFHTAHEGRDWRSEMHRLDAVQCSAAQHCALLDSRDDRRLSQLVISAPDGRTEEIEASLGPQTAHLFPFLSPALGLRCAKDSRGSLTR